MNAERILQAREERRTLVCELSRHGAVVTVKANVPGMDKNIPAARLCVAYFARLAENMGAHDLVSLEGDDGKCFVGKISDAEEYKAQAVSLEENHPIGRLVDIDVTEKCTDHSLTRGRLRRCFLCGEAAFVCSRRGSHTKNELIKYFDKSTSDFFLDYISRLSYEAMMAELELEDKFGLVSPTSCGSHCDLNYGSMLAAAETICPTLAQCFIVGLNAARAEGMLLRLRPIGVLCEEKMLKATRGANAYKGFIFVGGVLLAAAGFVIGQGLSFANIWQTARKICLDMLDGMPEDTFGYTAFTKNGFGGIRAEASAGFPTVRFAEEQLSAELDSTSRLKVLTDIVGRAEDSVLLKRAGCIERYEYYKDLISSLDVKNKEELERVNRSCVSENISIGGSADILIAAVLMRKIRNSFITEKKENEK